MDWALANPDEFRASAETWILNHKQLTAKWTGEQKFKVVDNDIIELLETGIDAPQPKKYVFDLNKVTAKDPKSKSRDFHNSTITNFR